MSPILLAAIVGVTFAVALFCGLATFFVKGFFEKLWRRLVRPITATLVIGWAVLAMAAVTQIDLATQVKGILLGANGGTGSAFVTFAGPTAARSFTVPDSNATLLTSNSAVTVAQGGTGATSFTIHGVMLGNAGSTFNATSAGTSGQCLMSNGASADPTFQVCPGGTLTWHEETPTGSINGTNTAFTLSATPANAAAVNCYLNGVWQQQGAGNDYTISGSAITYLAAPASGAKLSCSYPS